MEKSCGGRRMLGAVGNEPRRAAVFSVMNDQCMTSSPGTRCGLSTAPSSRCNAVAERGRVGVRIDTQKRLSLVNRFRSSCSPVTCVECDSAREVQEKYRRKAIFALTQRQFLPQ